MFVCCLRLRVWEEEGGSNDVASHLLAWLFITCKTHRIIKVDPLFVFSVGMMNRNDTAWPVARQ